MKLALPKFLKSKWFLISFLVVGIGVVSLITFFYLNRASGDLTDVNNVEELKALFNQDKGKVRVILLMSPT